MATECFKQRSRHRAQFPNYLIGAGKHDQVVQTDRVETQTAASWPSPSTILKKKRAGVESYSKNTWYNIMVTRRGQGCQLYEGLCLQRLDFTRLEMLPVSFFTFPQEVCKAARLFVKRLTDGATLVWRAGLQSRSRRLVNVSCPEVFRCFIGMTGTLCFLLL